MAMADDRSSDELESREPTVEDLRDLCRELNHRGAKYVVVGGFAIRAAGYIRSTMDVDLVVAADAENEARVFEALATLPDHAARELQPGELQQYTVIRVADEILVDLMRSAGGIDYAEASRDVIEHEVDKYRGSIEVPLTDAGLKEKLATCIEAGGHSVGTAQVDSFFEALMNVESETNVATFTRRILAPLFKSAIRRTNLRENSNEQ